MGLSVANLKRHYACMRETRVDEKSETERNEMPHVGQDNERSWCGRAGRWWSLVTTVFRLCGVRSPSYFCARLARRPEPRQLNGSARFPWRRDRTVECTRPAFFFFFFFAKPGLWTPATKLRDSRDCFLPWGPFQRSLASVYYFE